MDEKQKRKLTTDFYDRTNHFILFFFLEQITVFILYPLCPGKVNEDNYCQREHMNPTSWFPRLDTYHITHIIMHSIGLIVNILALLVISRLKTILRSHKLMATLALADIGSCLSTFLGISKVVPVITCNYGLWLKICYAYIIYHESMLAVGAYVYLILTVDRVVAIIKPLNYRTIMTRKKYVLYALLLVTHHVTVMSVAYLLFPNEEAYALEKLLIRHCNSTYLMNPYAKLYMNAFVTLLVLVNIGFCVVTVIFLIVTRKKRKRFSDGGSDGLSKATNTLIILSAFYAYLYMQLVVVGFLTLGNVNKTIRSLSYIFDYLFTLNNNINPIVYYIRMSELRKAFHRLLRCPWCLKPAATQNVSETLGRMTANSQTTMCDVTSHHM